eukprot:354903-Chlamydomonas_euryale.AAC.34
MPEYEEWKESLGGSSKGWKIKYYKGLGTSTSAEAKEYFATIDRHRKEFVWEGPEDDQAIELAFSKKRVEDRKVWCAHACTKWNRTGATVDYAQSAVSAHAFNVRMYGGGSGGLSHILACVREKLLPVFPGRHSLPSSQPPFMPQPFVHHQSSTHPCYTPPTTWSLNAPTFPAPRFTSPTKTWLSAYVPGTFLDMEGDTLTYAEFVNKELILYSRADLERSIPSAMDGLKPGQRKILFASFKKKLHKEEVKVRTHAHSAVVCVCMCVCVCVCVCKGGEEMECNGSWNILSSERAGCDFNVWLGWPQDRCNDICYARQAAGNRRRSRLSAPWTKTA